MSVCHCPDIFIIAFSLSMPLYVPLEVYIKFLITFTYILCTLRKKGTKLWLGRYPKVQKWKGPSLCALFTSKWYILVPVYILVPAQVYT